jgi:hypothetical protein
MLFMLVEHFRDGDPVPVYHRFRERGRLLAPGVDYVASWVTDDLKHCFQVMEAEHREALDAWIGRWSDLADFEVIPVITSDAAAQRVP